MKAGPIRPAKAVWPHNGWLRAWKGGDQIRVVNTHKFQNDLVQSKQLGNKVEGEGVESHGSTFDRIRVGSRLKITLGAAKNMSLIKLEQAEGNDDIFTVRIIEVRTYMIPMGKQRISYVLVRNKGNVRLRTKLNERK